MARLDRETLRALLDDAGRRVVWRTSVEPPPHARRLMAALGVEVVIETHGDGFQAHGYAAQDHRASVARAWRRRDAGETVEVCAGCETEVDVDQPVHSSRCPLRPPPVIKSGARGRTKKGSAEPSHEQPAEPVDGSALPERLDELLERERQDDEAA